MMNGRTRKSIGALLALMMILTGLAGCTPTTKEEKSDVFWTNPISLPDEWEQYGLGDPYVFSFNGSYYLYVSTRDTDAGIKVWSSTDLVKWEYRGVCTDDPVTMAAYAPEVIYWNGLFYMYTSPAGAGHYVLTSESPTGPFELATGNIGKSIDGSIFVDDDGQWYFYHAGPYGIEAAKMSDPLTFEESMPTEAFMGGWTEGPAVWKRNGHYYMTLTGNHVFSNAYRVDAAMSSSPLTGFKGASGNPALIRTEGKTVGLGHNSVVRGPDLDTQYMIYHNLEGPGIVGPLRHMNMDAIVWNGDRMSVLGPTSDSQPAPALPDFSDRFDREKLGSNWDKSKSGKWEIDPKEGLRLTAASGERAIAVSKEETKKDYTAEYHIKMDSLGEEQAKVGAVFSYKNEDNYGLATLNKKTNVLETRLIVDGVAGESQVAELPAGYDLTKWHLLRVEKAGSTFALYVDGMQKQKFESSLGGGKIGYASEGTDASFGYIAYSNKVNGSGAWDIYKPMPGTVQGVHYESGADGEAFRDKESLYRSGGVEIREDGEGGYAITNMEAGEWVDYRVNVSEASETGTYDIHFRVAGKSGTKFRLRNGETDMTGEIEIPADVKANEWINLMKESVKAEAGTSAWRLEVIAGKLELSSFTLSPHEDVVSASDDFEDGNDFGWTRYEGMWGVSKGALKASSAQAAKSVFGQHRWTDYTAEADIVLKDGKGNAGILVRVNNPANGMERNQNREDFVQGYYAYLDSEGVHLAKHNYDTLNLKYVAIKRPAGIAERLKVRVRGAVIEVYLGSGTEPVIVYEDRSASPYMQGGMGLKSVGESAYFDNVAVSPIS
ncbi:family 43 glycosylhydrolase [Cohnella cholangitidis]|uniref:Family 43 glycosylhydrolase n=1 Tax=Cohnella cholangitidis TaxID=2598458 RepID=A0A7G5BVR7_9BACL|nr:family 43 glycosylhydrolase [Cohnella cholangitidis]QMV41051.1 family 43 glycosylhydrolase [Cohnella cholangitidis]